MPRGMLCFFVLLGWLSFVFKSQEYIVVQQNWKRRYRGLKKLRVHSVYTEGQIRSGSLKTMHEETATLTRYLRFVCLLCDNWLNDHKWHSLETTTHSSLLLVTTFPIVVQMEMLIGPRMGGLWSEAVAQIQRSDRSDLNRFKPAVDISNQVMSPDLHLIKSTTVATL